MKNRINLGVFGLGTVGKGVLELLSDNQLLIEKKLAGKIRVVKAVTAHPEKDRGLDLSQIQVTNNLDDILQDPEIDIVLEMIGGTTTAKEIIFSALKSGKSVITANKALLAEYTEEVFGAAYRSQGFLGFEASVAGVIPVIRNLKTSFCGEQIESISGIINGTANYILSSMIEDKAEFKTALKDAQKKGYAEADPKFDIDGTDTAHKLILLMDLAFSGLFEFKDVYVEGITDVTPIDIEIAEQFGYTIKLLGKAVSRSSGVEGRVHPTLIPKASIMSSVRGAFNAVAMKSNFAGESLSYGAGAGSHPTASAIVGDLIEISRSLLKGVDKVTPPLSVTKEHLVKKPVLPIEEIETEYYLRFSVLDEVGVMGQITKILGDNEISICSMLQKGEEDTPHHPIHVIIFTHQAKEKNIRLALNRIDKLPFVTAKTKLIRVDTE